MSKSNFIIAENNVLYRLGLSALIHEKIPNAIIEYASDTNELRHALFSTQSAVVIADTDTFHNEHPEFFHNLSCNFPGTNWLFIAEIADEAFIVELTRIMHHANIALKTNEQDVISTAIANTAKGLRYFCSEALQAIMDNHNRKQTTDIRRNVLTSTELELVQLFAQGKTAKEVALLRSSSFHTVNTHRKNIFRKLQINNIQELIKYALKHDLLDLTEYYI